MVGLQEIIHKFEVGEGARYLKALLGAVALLALAVVYDLREFSNFASQDAMDAAQLARNISEGEGYTTRFVRPLSMHLLQERRRELLKSAPAGAAAQSADDPAFLKASHPDISNPPVYPVVLAGLMKVIPFRFELPKSGSFSTYQPEMIIALFNQILMLIAATQLYFLARRLFDGPVAFMSVVLFVGAELFWRFSVSGHSTLLLVNFFILLVHLITRLEDATRVGEKGAGWFVGMSIAVGVVAGLGMLTRYGFGWILVPVLALFFVYGGQRRFLIPGLISISFALVVLPWLLRNHSLSGNFFGTAALAVYSGSKSFPSDHLERSLTPNFEKVDFDEFLRKLVVNGGEIVQSEVPLLGGSLASAFFLVGLLVAFRNPALTRLRLFLVATILVWIVAQALGRTYQSTDSPLVNSENLLIILSPVVFIYGAALFLMLLDQVELPFPEARPFITGLFLLIACAPLIIRLLPPKTFPVAFPPYHPPTVQTLSGWMGPKDLMMSDIPWAVAWYGRRQCVWSVLDAQEDFYAIHDFQKPVSALYLTQRTSDAKFHSEMVKPQNKSWEWFILQSMLSTNIPSGFPLKKSIGGFSGVGHLFLTDRQRW